jgi:acyl-coenzyme A synthetase/AMP-(fatty) acid ligase
MLLVDREGRRRGLARGDRVLVLVGKRPEWHEMMLGAIKAGLVAIPCSEQLRARDLSFRARHSRPRLLVAEPPGREEIERMDERLDLTTTRPESGWIRCAIC